jgi:hypothetical protein
MVTNAAPPSIVDALGALVVPEHVGRVQAFVRDGVVLTHKGQRRLVLKVRALVARCLTRLCQECDRLAPPIAALLAMPHPPLRTLQRPFRFAVSAVTTKLRHLATWRLTQQFCPRRQYVKSRVAAINSTMISP